ncbi:thioredoxin family protein [Parafilimonas sp.]|uniref:thioredoxin family protein n=1 Tax=Parafilimonas sp. TaxID=1969739 RepID=UPI0039E4E90F
MKGILIILSVFIFLQAKSQSADTAHLYNPEADAEKEIAAAVKQAKAEHKFVLIQGGGNWCSWCKRFSITVAGDAALDSIVKANFIVYHLNYSEENKNQKLFARYGYPQRFGFPVFIILDENGNRIHTQNSAYLEEGKGYNKEKIAEFFRDWRPAALDPKNYTAK